MKNPWMSLWLSEYNKAASAAKGQMAAEISRQQNAAMEAWAAQTRDAWLAVWVPWSPQAAEARRRWLGK